MKRSGIIRMRGLLSAASLLMLSLGMAVAGFGGSTASADYGVKLVSNVWYGNTSSEVVDEYLPTVKAATPTPAVIFIHGGAWGGGDKSEWSTYAQNFTATTGWPAFNMNYNKTSTTPYTTEPKDVSTLTSLIKSHAANFNVDPTRIGLVGDSAGGHLALLAATTGTGPDAATGSRVKAVVSWSGASDMPLITSDLGCYDTFCNTNAQFLGYAAQHFEGKTLAPDVPDRWATTSPIDQVDPTDPPTLMFNSTNEFMPYDQMTGMADKLTANNVPVQTVTYTNGQHAMQYASIAWPPTLAWLQANL